MALLFDLSKFSMLADTIELEAQVDGDKPP